MDFKPIDWKNLKEAAKKAAVDTGGFDESFAKQLLELIETYDKYHKLQATLAKDFSSVQQTAKSYRDKAAAMERKYKDKAAALAALDAGTSRNCARGSWRASESKSASAIVTA
jgi:uncharacterized coiled-coil DUF342 family protein